MVCHDTGVMDRLLTINVLQLDVSFRVRRHVWNCASQRKMTYTATDRKTTLTQSSKQDILYIYLIAQSVIIVAVVTQKVTM